VYQSLQTVGSLLLTNADFRVFLSDLTTLSREVFQDTAATLSRVAEEAGQKVAPSDEAVADLESPSNNVHQKPPSPDDLGSQVAEVSKTVTNGAAKVVEQAKSSATEKLSGPEGNTLQLRLKQAILKLRKRSDYEDSVSTLSLLLKRWVLIYSRGLGEASDSLEEDVHENVAADRAVRNAWSLLTSFGDKNEWDELERRLKQVMSHKNNDPELENFVTELSGSIQKLLTDPDFLDQAEDKFHELQEKSKEVGTESNLRSDIDAFLAQCKVTARSVRDDKDVANIIHSTTKLIDILSPAGEYVNSSLLHDTANVFLPLLIRAVQTIPIPRIEISTPQIDLLLENLIITPGKTVNHSSFFPYRFGVTTLTDFVVRKSYTSTITSSVSTIVTLKFDGLSLRAEDIGFWLRTHTGLLHFTDSGLASFALDERGLDVHIDVEIAQHSIDNILSLKAVRVQAHKLNFSLRSSVFSLCSWLFRPLLRLLLRKTLERQFAKGVAAMLKAANRELVFARERLRATRVADPKDLMTFFKAVAARLTPEDDPDVYSRIGIDEPGRGVFRGKYAPGSLVKLWHEEGGRAEERVEDGADVIGRGKESWRNEVFDVHVSGLT
jgi:Family of unknown function (DUF5923)